MGSTLLLLLLLLLSLMLSLSLMQLLPVRGTGDERQSATLPAHSTAGVTSVTYTRATAVIVGTRSS